MEKGYKNSNPIIWYFIHTITHLFSKRKHFKNILLELDLIALLPRTLSQFIKGDFGETAVASVNNTLLI